MSDSNRSSLQTEITKGLFYLFGALLAAYVTLVAAGVIDLPWAKSKIDSQLRSSMTELKTGLEELDTALEVEGKGNDGTVYCRQSHPANFLHGYEVVLKAKTYDMSGEPKYIKSAYAEYQKAIQTVNSENVQKIYNACLIFDRTDSGDPKLSQEQFDFYTLQSQEDVTSALAILDTAIGKMP
jgi:hypothetical protein